MIILDTETTGLIKPMSIPMDQQPEIVEVGAVKLDAELKEVGSLNYLCKPRVPISPEVSKMNGITNDMLKDQPSFGRQLVKLEDFILGEAVVVAHNCAYDMGMLLLELTRLNRVSKFPWPPRQLCTVEMTMDLAGHRLKLGELYVMAMGVEPAIKHRALDDVRSLADVVRWLRKKDQRI